MMRAGGCRAGKSLRFGFPAFIEIEGRMETLMPAIIQGRPEILPEKAEKPTAIVVASEAPTVRQVRDEDFEKDPLLARHNPFACRNQLQLSRIDREAALFFEFPYGGNRVRLPRLHGSLDQLPSGKRMFEGKELDTAMLISKHYRTDFAELHDPARRMLCKDLRGTERYLHNS